MSNSPDLPFTVAAIAIGPIYNSWAKSMIETLRSAGDFSGPIHILTDNPEQFRGLPAITTTLTTNPGADLLEIKKLKTGLLDIVDAEYVLYLDVDVLVGAPLRDWFNKVEAPLADYAAATFPQAGKEGEPFHTGVMLLTRRASKDLAAWREVLDSGHFDRDQPAFAAAVTPSNIYIMSDDDLLFPSRVDMEAETIRTFVHITFTGRQTGTPPSVLRRYLRRGLVVEQLPSNCRLSVIWAASIRARWAHARSMISRPIKQPQR